MKHIEKIMVSIHLNEEEAVVFNWEIYAKQCDVSIESKNRIKKTINSTNSQ